MSNMTESSLEEKKVEPGSLEEKKAEPGQEGEEEKARGLDEMPDNVLQKIFNFIDVYEKVTTLRYVCHKFKENADASVLLYRNLSFYVHWGRVTIYVTMPCGRFTHLTYYSSTRSERRERSEPPSPIPDLLHRKSVNVPGGKFVEAAVDHVMKLVNDRKVAFQGFMISLATMDEAEKRKAMKLLATALEKSDRWLQVTAFTIENEKNEEDLVRILANIKPKFLKFLYLQGKFTPRLPGLTSTITQMDQWKNAKHVQALDFDMTGAYQCYQHLNTCELYVQVADLPFYLSIINHFRENAYVTMQEFTCIRERNVEEEAELTEYIMNNDHLDDEGLMRFPNMPGHLKVIIKPLSLLVKRIL